MTKKYHFIGIGGIGMGALAFLLLEKGFKVSGTDIRENQLTGDLKKKGAEVYLGHDAQYVKDADIVVYSSAIKEDNPEFKSASLLKKKILRRAELLAQLMAPHTGITVAGAHGKTTTSSMIATLLSRSDFNPTVAVGGIVMDTLSNANLGKGEYFVAEVDESDGSFLYFSPKYSVITNIDYEHIDYYESFEDLLGCYKQFILQTQSDGCVIACGDDENIMTLLEQTKKTNITYGLSGDNDYRLVDYRSDGKQSRFFCYKGDQNLGEVTLNVPGRHNALNALACIVLGLQLDIRFEKIVQEMRAFQGVQRRFHLKGDINSIKVIDDYAHHPTEIKCTLSTAGELNAERLIVIFQPHRYTRLSALKEDFIEALSSCQNLIVTDIYAASEQPIEGISGENFKNELQKYAQGSVEYIAKDQLVEHLLGTVKENDLVLTLGAGDITKISKDFVDALGRKFLKQEIST